ncbi:MAG: LptF/LptG family permease [candidate division Zixibacteria bacterium]|nr:LptF/LptG family permease [candidate division Zixibacteria bacterium]
MIFAPKALDRYLLRYFLQSLLVVTVAIGLTIIVINMVEQLRDFIDHHVPLIDVLTYYLYFGGWVVKSFLPVFVLLATLFSVSILARRNEILAMKASGRSLYRISYPLIVMGALLSVGHFYYNEYLFPPANRRRLEIKEFTIEKRAKATFTNVRNIYRLIAPGYFYTLGDFNAERDEGQQLRVCKTEKNKIREIIVARLVEYRDFKWIGREVAIRTFDDSAHESFQKLDSLVLPDIKDTPEDLEKRIGKPEDMSLDELKRYIEVMKRTGGPHLKESIDLKLKYSYPMTSFIVVLICIPFASNPKRAGIATSFAVGASLALAYFVLFRIMQSFGYNEKIPVDLAVWGVNGLFFLIGLALMVGARK